MAVPPAAALPSGWRGLHSFAGLPARAVRMQTWLAEAFQEDWQCAKQGLRMHVGLWQAPRCWVMVCGQHFCVDQCLLRLLGGARDCAGRAAFSVLCKTRQWQRRGVKSLFFMICARLPVLCKRLRHQQWEPYRCIDAHFRTLAVQPDLAPRNCLIRTRS